MEERAIPVILLACVVLLIAACGGEEEPAPSQAVAQNTAQSPPTATSEPGVAAAGASTAMAAPPTVTAAPVTGETAPEATATATPIATPTAAPACTVVFDGLNFRYGPGIAFDPPLGTLSQDTQLLPLAFSAIGYPQGQWLQVQVASTGETGWVSGLPEYVVCNVALTTLPPPATVPPTPTAVPPTLAPTPASIIAQLPELSDDLGTCGEPLSCELVPSANAFLQVRVFDTEVGTQDGAGISHVEFIVTDSAGTVVHERTERQAGYCIFGGGEPNCNPWRIDDGVYKWPGGAAVIDGEEYVVNVRAYREGQDFFEANWTLNVSFDVP